MPVSEASFDQAISELVYCRPRWSKARPAKYVAFYRVSPRSAVTHLSEVASVSDNEAGTQVYRFREPPKPLATPIPSRPLTNGRRMGIQSYKYTTLEKIRAAKNMREL